MSNKSCCLSNKCDWKIEHRSVIGMGAREYITLYRLIYLNYQLQYCWYYSKVIDKTKRSIHFLYYSVIIVKISWRNHSVSRGYASPLREFLNLTLYSGQSVKTSLLDIFRFILTRGGITLLGISYYLKTSIVNNSAYYMEIKGEKKTASYIVFGSISHRTLKIIIINIVLYNRNWKLDHMKFLSGRKKKEKKKKIR